MWPDEREEGRGHRHMHDRHELQFHLDAVLVAKERRASVQNRDVLECCILGCCGNHCLDCEDHDEETQQQATPDGRPERTILCLLIWQFRLL